MRSVMLAGAEVGGGRDDTASAGSDGGRGAVGHGGLKKESFNNFFDIGAGAYCMRGVISASEVVELEDAEVVATRGAMDGSGGRNEVEEKGEAKNAFVLLPFEDEGSPELIGESGGWSACSDEVEVDESAEEIEDVVVRILR